MKGVCVFKSSVMALLPILRYPDPRLKKVASVVTQFDDQLACLVQDMAETMYDAPGVGLAATQVDVHKRVIVVDVSEDKTGLTVFINPEVVQASSECKTYEEGCLSVPGIYENVERPETVCIRAQNVKGDFLRWIAMACWRCAFNTKWTTCKARCLWNICLSSSKAALKTN